MNRRDFLKIGTAGLVAGAWMAKAEAAPAPDPDFLDSLSKIKPMDTVISIQPYYEGLDCFRFLTKVPYHGVVGVVGEDAESRTLVAHACAHAMNSRVNTLLYDPYFPIGGPSPAMPVLMMWQNCWMHDKGPARFKEATRWFRQLIADCRQYEHAAVAVVPMEPRPRPLYGWGDTDDACYMSNGAYMFFCSAVLRVTPTRGDMARCSDITATVKKNRWDIGPDRGTSFYFRKTGGLGLKEVCRVEASV